MNNKDFTCCFTGHRTVPPHHLNAVREAVRYYVRELRLEGYTDFMTGGALGFDTIAAEVVLEMAQQDPGLRLILAIPCLNQTEQWTNLPNAIDHLRTYKSILGRAGEVIYVSEHTYFDGCMKLRNAYMIDHSSACIAYWNGKKRSGTAQTVRLAQKAGHRVINIFEDLVEPE